jgi:hypothetical protein
MKENWQNIPNFESYYQVSNLGRVRGLDRIIIDKNGKKKRIKGQIIKPQYATNGYLFIRPCKNGIKSNFLLHRIVAQMFISNPQNKQEINHKDFNKTNNVFTNLEWCTHSENHKHLFHKGIRNKYFINNTGSNNGRTRLTEDKVKQIKILLLNGKKHKDIAKLYDVSKSVVDQISSGKNWKHVNINL